MQGVTCVWYYSGKTKSTEDSCPGVKRDTNEPHPTAVKKVNVSRQKIKGMEKTSKKIDGQQKIEKKKTHRKLTDEVSTEKYYNVM